MRAPSVLQARVVDWGKCVGWVPHTLPWVIQLPGARRQGPWRLAPLPRQQVNGQAGSAGQGPDARDPGVFFVTQTPGTLASPKKVRNEIFFGTRSNRDLVCLKGQNSNFVQSRSPSSSSCMAWPGPYSSDVTGSCLHALALSLFLWVR